MTSSERFDLHERTRKRWREQAACRETDPELFFPVAESGPVREAQVRAAKQVCAGCPVRAECLAAALARSPYGIAGGLTERERRRLRRSQPAVLVGEAGEVWVDGPRDGLTKKQRAGTGRALLAAGRPARQVARACGVSTRTVQRWAARADPNDSTSATSTSTTDPRRTTSTSGSGAGGGEPRLPPGSPWINAQPGTRTAEGIRD